MLSSRSILYRDSLEDKLSNYRNEHSSALRKLRVRDSRNVVMFTIALGLIVSSTLFGFSFAFSSSQTTSTSTQTTTNSGTSTSSQTTTSTQTTTSKSSSTTQSSTSTTASSTSKSSTETSSTQSSYPTSDMPTYVADYRNPTVALQLTGIGLTQKYVPGAGHKIYAYFFVNPAQTSPIPMSGVVKQVSFDVTKTTNNIYWFAGPNTKSYFGTVGADILMSPADGNPTIDQYVNVNSRATGLPHDSPLADCLPAAKGIPSSINSGGEERDSIYLVLADKTENFAYIIKGGILLYRSSGEVDIVFLIDSTMTTHFSSTAVCSVPTLTFSAPEIDWAVRAPSSTNTIPGNYQLYPTTGGYMNEEGGTSALCLYQEIDPS